MNRMFSIWGKSGSGKSTTSANIACALAGRGFKTALIGAGRFYGSIQYYLDMEFTAEQSLRGVLAGRDSLAIQSYFCECPKVKNLFVATLSNQDDSAGYQKPGVSTVVRFINLIKSNFEVSIIDCDDSIEDPLSMIGLTSSHGVFFMTRPDIQSAVFAKAHRSIITGLSIDEKLLTVFVDDGRKRNPADYEPFGQAFQTLPFCAEIASKDCASSLIVLTRCVTRSSAAYKKAILGLTDIMMENDEAGDLFV